MNRRGFLGAILAAAAAPAIVRAESLMPTRSGILVPEPTKLWRPNPYIIQTMDGGLRGLQMGDLFTIAGVSGTFRATNVQSGPHDFITLEPVIFPALPSHDDRFSDDPWS